jgi:hypothetical protein
MLIKVYIGPLREASQRPVGQFDARDSVSLN